MGSKFHRTVGAIYEKYGLGESSYLLRYSQALTLNTSSAGCAVLKCKDDLDRPKGKKVAFGRALEAMLPYHVCETEYDKWVFKYLREKFWNALLPQL